MLLQFSVENFLSIKERITLSMVASKDKSLNQNIIKINKISLLKSAAIYGPNASGKTNILRAISFLFDLIKTSHTYQPNQSIFITPFRLDSTYEGKPSKFEIILILDNIKYIYGVALDEEKIYDEYLYFYPKGRPSIIFDRTGTNNYKFTKDVKRQNDIKINTPDNTLYLSKSANLNYEPTFKIIKQLIDNITIIIDQDMYLTYTYGSFTKDVLTKKGAIKDNIKKLVRKADKGIVALEVVKQELSDDFAKGFPQEFRDFMIDEESRIVETTHMGLDERGDQIRVSFGLSDEAGGTKRIFNMAGPFIDVLSSGKLLVIDEIETSLHPNLVRHLINVFNNPEFNKKGAQLIFATHNTSLLRFNILRRDQVWLAEKKPDQSTDLRSVFEYKARKGENIEKGYLSGRYGALPILD